MSKGSNRLHTLLTFAHRGEAKAFLQELKWRPLNKDGDLYELSEERELPLSLLITGEGRDQVLIKLSATLAGLQEKFPNDQFTVLNLGVCGHLFDHPQKFEREQVVSVKTSYGQKGLSAEEMEFKSFPSQKGSSEYSSELFSNADIVSTNVRVLDSKTANHLSHFAPLVDREAWATGLVCAQFGVPFDSLKVISDFADGDICVRVKEETDRWSDLLLRAFYQWTEENNASSKEVEEGLWPEFTQELHITVSQERRLRNLIKALTLKGKTKEQILKHTDFESIIIQDVRPKDKTKLLLEALTDYLNPLEKKLREELDQVTAGMRGAGFNVRFDQGHESEIIHLSSDLENEAQINKMIAALESFDFNKFRQLMRGESLQVNDQERMTKREGNV